MTLKGLALQAIHTINNTVDQSALGDTVGNPTQSAVLFDGLQLGIPAAIDLLTLFESAAGLCGFSECP